MRIADELREDIAAGRIAIGDALPSYTTIARAHDVSVSTAQKAVMTLQAEGLVGAVHGSGVYVTAVPAPDLDAHGHDEDRLASMEARLERIEHMLETLTALIDRE
ncbi:hypothetical protein Acsp05_64290 [Actinokineospora sp. NBRC 105648]|nr:hypothetical protein Acsp05_64290 [Actinokineospora sp. NBRC 105648]